MINENNNDGNNNVYPKHSFTTYYGDLMVHSIGLRFIILKVYSIFVLENIFN